MVSDAGGRPQVKGMTGHPPAVCSRVWPRRREKNDDRQLTNGMVERAANVSFVDTLLISRKILVARPKLETFPSKKRHKFSFYNSKLHYRRACS